MHFSVYYRLVDLLWDHLSDEELFRRLARYALVLYFDYKKFISHPDLLTEAQLHLSMQSLPL